MNVDPIDHMFVQQPISTSSLHFAKNPAEISTQIIDIEGNSF